MKNFFNFKKLIIASIALVVLVNYSCKNDETISSFEEVKSTISDYSKNVVDESIKGDFQVIGGILHFKDSKAFNTYYDKLAKLPISEREGYFSQYGLKSLLDTYREFHNNLNNTKNQIEYNTVTSKYSKIVQVDKNDKIFNFTNDNLVEASFLNAQGLVFIGKMVFKFENSFETIVLDGDISKIDNKPSKTVIKFNRVVKNKLRPNSSCISNTKTTYGNDRRNILSFNPSIIIIPTASSIELVTVRGYAIGRPYKRNIFGSWVSYNTNNELRSSWTFWSNDLLSGAGQSINDEYTYDNNWDAIDYSGQPIYWSTSNSGAINSGFDMTDQGYYKMVNVNLNNQMVCY
jgi:hypothetical protein